MAKTLDKSRPTSTIADLIDSDLIEQAVQEAVPSPEPDDKGQLDAATRSRDEAVRGQGATPAPDSGNRTGEHSDIQKMYRLTPTALRTLKELSQCLSSNLGFEINNSAVFRSILRVVQQAELNIHRLADERIQPRRQPSTAIGSEHLRDALEAELAGIIMEGIRRYAEDHIQE